jgi:tripartite-type tricarboxylate transporter receptor subunit TctC
MQRRGPTEMENNMKVPRRQFLGLAAATAVLPALSRIAGAQAYPTRPLRWIVGFPPGSGSDGVVRILGTWLSERLGQPVIIENKPGGGTNLSIQAAANSAPDGYTLVLLGSSSAINTTLYPTLPFNILRDIDPVAGLVRYPMVLAANPSVPAKTVIELIAHAKAHPGEVMMASFGIGTPSHVAGELLKRMAGVEMVHVPYRGGAPMIVDLLSGQVHVAFDILTISLAHIRSGALRGLAVASKTRLEGLPDIPTVGDTLPGFEASVWGGIGVPRGTPPEIVERLTREINAGLANPAIQTKIANLGGTPLILTAPELRAYLTAEIERWGEVVRFSGAKPD